MTDKDRNPDGTFAVGNRAALVHGGDIGRAQISKGLPLTGLAAESQREVEAELENDGRAAIVRRAAIRLEAVARLFYNAILTAVENGDFSRLALYAQRHAWLESRALAAWEQLRREEKERDSGASARDVLRAIEAEDEHS